MQGDCRRNCNYDYINRLAFRNFFTAFYSNLKRRTFCTRSQLTWRDFFPVIQCLIEEFCSCYTEPHRRVRAQAKTRNNNHSWTTNRAKLWMICDLLALRPISHITKKTLPYLHSTKIEQMTKTMVIFKRGAIFLCCVRCDPIPPQTSVQRLAHTRNVTTCCCLSSKNINLCLLDSVESIAQGMKIL